MDLSSSCHSMMLVRMFFALRMHRSFHYFDEKGKDQGINGNVFRISPLIRFYPTFFSCLAVQNCSKVLVKCLADVIRRSSGTRPTEVNMSDVTWWGLRLSATVVFMDPT